MNASQTWDTTLSGIGPATHSRSVLVVRGDDAEADGAALEELRRWGWKVTMVGGDADTAALTTLARRHDVALFCDIRGTRGARRTLTALLPTVAVVVPRDRGRTATLLREAGIRRDTTVLIVRDPRDAKILRRLSGSALVRSVPAGSVRDRAAALGVVLLRAHAWQFAPARRRGSGPVIAAG